MKRGIADLIITATIIVVVATSTILHELRKKVSRCKATTKVVTNRVSERAVSSDGNGTGAVIKKLL